MLAAADIQAFLQRLPKNFRLIINGVTYNVNRQNLSAFSSVVRSSLSTDPDLTELRLDIAAPDAVVSAAIAFLHGSPLDPPSTQLFVGASLGLDILSRRLVLPVFESTTPANVDERFRALKPFPAFFSPILMFLDRDRSTFDGFVQRNILHPAFVSQTARVFSNEDAKFEFLQRCHEAAADPTLFRALSFEDLSAPVLRRLFADAAVLGGCRTFARTVEAIEGITGGSRRRTRGASRQHFAAVW
jgi:hypothetical protein